MRIITFLVLCIFLKTGFSDASIYKWVDPSGQVIFSDTPREGAEKLTLEPLPTVKLLDGQSLDHSMGIDNHVGSDPQSNSYAVGSIYSELKIGSPQHNATIPTGSAGSFELEVVLTPQLAQGHAIQLMMDGQPFGEPSMQTTFQFSNIERGSHIFSVKIIDTEEGDTLASSSDITVHVKRNTVLFKSAAR